MKLDDFKKVWKQQNQQQEYDYSPAELMMLINNKVVSLEKEIKSRDRLEVIAAVVVIICFGGILFTTSSLWQQLGSGVIIISAIIISYKLMTTQVHSLSEEPAANRPMRTHLEDELHSLQQQKQLLQRIAWWYILPIWKGLLLFTVGFESGFWIKLGYMSVVTIAGIAIWSYNQNAVEKKFDPLISEIREAIVFLEEDSR
jgi:hypothetical protein